MISPKDALKKLIEGNKRFYDGTAIHPNRCEEARASLVEEQRPYVAILSCSDSRAPVEIIFDAGLGDIFSVRTAGHVLSPVCIGSLEYAVRSLGVKLIVILGHSNCGAVKSALSAHKSTTPIEMSENLEELLAHIYPVLDSLSNSQTECSLDEVITANIKYQVEDLLKKDKLIAQKVQNQEIMLVGANYDLETGKVDFYQSTLSGLN